MALYHNNMSMLHTLDGCDNKIPNQSFDFALEPDKLFGIKEILKHLMNEIDCFLCVPHNNEGLNESKEGTYTHILKHRWFVAELKTN